MDLVCFSHLRWDFVFQRPNHLLSRAARRHRVFFIEEPIADAERPWTDIVQRHGVEVVTPHIVGGDRDHEHDQLRGLLAALFAGRRIGNPVLWYYTPMALPWSGHLRGGARAVVYDCMDHLAGFADAPSGIVELERQLMGHADIVFTGGQSLFEARRHSHPSVHCFPSSVDTAHFGRARHGLPEPMDQASIPHPRLGYFGVLDERIDWELLRETAARRPDWQLVLVGPFAKVDPRRVPQAPNIHYLGMKSYADLPAYLAGWDAALMPFARNEATRFISPTKTPEYLAGGRPVAATRIHDVVEPYGNLALVHLGDTPDEFQAAIERALGEDVADLRRRADRFLAGRSWDATWVQMEAILERAIVARALRRGIPGLVHADRPSPAPASLGSASLASTSPNVGAPLSGSTPAGVARLGASRRVGQPSPAGSAPAGTRRMEP